jgi:NAD+ synthase
VIWHPPLTACYRCDDNTDGFFVKLGDGAADVKPIAHLYKSQIYQLAEYLGVPELVRQRPPTTDTYSLPQGQDEFYFSLPYPEMDLCLFAKNNGYGPADVASLVGLSVEQTERVFKDIDAKRSATRYLHAAPRLMDVVPEFEIE